MRLSSLTNYAVVMMSAAARHCGGMARLNATLLAEQTGVPLPTAQKLVSRLSAAGLIESARGTGGGFRLARPPSAITLADVVEALEGPIRLTARVEDARDGAAIGGNGHIAPRWGLVDAAVRGAMAGITLTDLSRAPVAAAAKTHSIPALAGEQV